MATSPEIRVMLSSRCDDPFSSEEKTSLTEIRRAIKQEIETQSLFDFRPFKVWINEDAEALDHSEDSWEACLKQVRDCDILIVLYNGNAGWAKTGEDVGICHAEYVEGLKTSPGKVRLIELPQTCDSSIGPAQKERNARFSVFKNKASAFRGGEVKDIAELKNQVFKALFDAVLAQTRRGGKDAKGGRFDLGAALEWSRLDFAGRSDAMARELYAALLGRDESEAKNESLLVQIADHTVLVKIHAAHGAPASPRPRRRIGAQCRRWPHPFCRLSPHRDRDSSYEYVGVP